MKLAKLIGIAACFGLATLAAATPHERAMVFTTGSGELAAPALAQYERGQEQTFEGKILKKEGQYVFEDSTGKSYMLDNQEKAKEFDGKKVKVKGTLTVATNTIRVAEIEVDET